MIPRHASHTQGHVHLAAGLTDSSKGRQADTEGDRKRSTTVSISGRAFRFWAVTETAPETGLIMFNARQSRWPEDRVAQEDGREVLICWGTVKSLTGLMVQGKTGRLRPFDLAKGHFQARQRRSIGTLKRDGVKYLTNMINHPELPCARLC